MKIMAAKNRIKELLEEFELGYSLTIDNLKRQLQQRTKKTSKYIELERTLSAAQRQQKIITQLLEETTAISDLQFDKLQSKIKRSLTSLLAFIKKNYPGQKLLISQLEKTKQEIFAIKSEWFDFIYVWAIETNDPNIGKRNLELHFGSQSVQGSEELVSQIGQNVFMRLLTVQDLDFMSKMNVEPFTSGEFINGLRTVKIPKPATINYKLQVKDEDYGFQRVNKSGTFPDEWWLLSPSEIWDILKQGLKVEVHRGTKGRLSGKSIISKLQQIKTQKGLQQFFGEEK